MSYIEQSSLVKVTEEIGEVQNQSSQEPWADLLALEKDPKLLEECVAYAIYSHPSKRRRGMNFTEEIRPGNMQSRGGQESPKQAKGKAATKKKFILLAILVVVVLIILLVILSEFGAFSSSGSSETIIKVYNL